MTGQSLLCRVGERLYAIPIEHVVETMRPLPTAPIAGAPDFVSGLSIVRGEPLPVVSAARLVNEAEATRPGRFVTLRSASGHVALAVDEVVGLRRVPAERVHDLPPLLRDAAASVVAQVGSLDAQLLVVLRTMHLVPASLSESLARPR